MSRRTLKFKIGLYLTLALSAVMILFTILVAWYQRNELIDTAGSHVMQLSEVITKSTRFAMLQNHPADVDTILRDVAHENGINRIRIISQAGKITHSTFASEIGQTVNRRTEACSHCHESEKPLRQIPEDRRTWTFASAEGPQLLASMQVLHNEPSCYTAACHQHSQDVSVLGVVEILYSLDTMDQRIRWNVLTIAAFSLGFVILVAVSVSVFVHRLVYMPLRDLKLAAAKVSSGDLEDHIPVRSEDEFGELAQSFNAMTVALRDSRSELRDWAHTLEEKVEERTRQLRLAQAEAARGEKLASVGLLAAGVAHELNNPLTGVLTFAHLQRQKMEAGSEDAEDMDIIIRETKRCANIIRRLLDFARDKPPEKKFSDLNQIAEETIRIVEGPAFVRNISITMELDRELPQIWADPEQIKQVIMNLVVNAEHAVEDAGSIVIRTRLLPRREIGADEPPTVELSVTDNGKGIPEEHLGRIFDPFFTTKEAGTGTGLGLSVSHGIMEAHGGTITVESKVGEGSTFRVTLPLIRSPELVEH